MAAETTAVVTVKMAEKETFGSPTATVAAENTASNGENLSTNEMAAIGGEENLQASNGENLSTDEMAAGGGKEILHASNGGEALQTTANGDGEASMLEMVARDATALGLEIGQRVELAYRGKGIVLFAEKPLSFGLKSLPGNDQWYGVALDEENGMNIGCADGVKYFHCRENYGMFVQSVNLQKAEMSVNNIVLKSLLGGAVVAKSKLEKLTKPLLRVFLEHKGVVLKDDVNGKGESKDELIVLASEAMRAVLPTATPVKLVEGLHVASVADEAMCQSPSIEAATPLAEVQSDAANGLDGEPFSALEAVLRERDSAPIKEVPAIFVEGTYLEGIVAEFRGLLDESLGIMLSAKGSNTTKKFQIEGPMRKLKLALARMESAFASIESSDVSGDESDAKSLTSVSPVSAAVTLKPVAKFRLDLPPATTKPEKWSASIPEVTATIARLAAGGDQQLKDKEGSVVNPPPTVPQATFSSSFATTGISARFVQWDHDAISAAGSRAQGSVGAFSKVEHSTTLPAAVQGQEGTIGVTNQDQGAVKMTGEIIKLFHWDRYGFIRSERSGDFFIGSAEFWPMMKVGDRVEFLHYPRIPLQGRCPMAMDIGKQQGGRTSGAQPAALSSITAYPALVVTNPRTIKANPKGVKAGVATGAAQSGA